MATIRERISNSHIMENSEQGGLDEVEQLRKVASKESDSSGDRIRDVPIGLLIRLARLKHDLSQIELAKATGYSNGWISRVERGEVIPTKSFLEAIEFELSTDLGSDVWVDRKRLGDCGESLMTPTETALYLGVSRTYVYSLMDSDYSKSPVLDYTTVDGFKRIKIVDVAEYVGYSESTIREWLKERRSRV